MKLFALEACAECQAQGTTASATPPGQQADGVPNDQKFTYDEGEGVKDKIVISGPLSHVLREAMNQIFVKKSIVVSDDPGAVDAALSDISDNKAPATESQAQDAYISAMIKTIEETPGTDVVLSDFDYHLQNEHVKKVQEGSPLNQSDQDPAIIPMFVARAEDLARPDIYEQLANNEDLNVVVVSGVDTSSGEDDITDVNYVATGGGIARALYQDNQDHVIVNQEPTSNLIKAAALERFYEGTKVRLFFGMESFMQELLNYRSSKKAATK